MKKKLIFVISVVIVLALCVWYFWPNGPVPTGKATPAPTGDGWVNLLDAEHAKNWSNLTDNNNLFDITDGSLHISGSLIPLPLRYVGYSEKFENFDLHVEFKVSRGANSGLFLRTQPGDTTYRGFEIQVLDDFGTAPNKNGSGSIYDVASPMYNMAFPAGEWNSYDITLDGSEVIVHMNGWMVLHTDLSKMTMPIGKFKAPFANLPHSGGIAFQDHGGEVWYRNVMIHPR